MKKITFPFNAVEWKKQLRPLFLVVERSTVLAVLEKVRISIKNNIASFYATDLENACVIKIPVDCDKVETVFCLDARDLKNFLFNAFTPECTCSIDTNNKDNDRKSVTLSTEEFRVKLDANEHGDNFPLFPIKEPHLDKLLQKPVEVMEFTIDTSVIRPFITKALPFVSGDDLRPAMTGINFMHRNGFLEIAATDAHRLYWENIIPIPSMLKRATFIVPKKGCALFLELFKTGDVTIYISKNNIWFENDTTLFCSRLIDARFPDYMVVIPTYDLHFFLKRSQLKSFLNIAAMFSNRSTHQMKMSITPNSIGIEGEDLDFYNSFSYTLPVYLNSAYFLPFATSMNIRFVQQIIAINKDEYIKISHSGLGNMKAFIFDDHFLLMPLAIN